MMTKEIFIKWDDETGELHCTGDWIIANLSKIQPLLEHISLPNTGSIIINGKKINKMDSAGAIFLIQWLKTLPTKHLKGHFKHFADQHKRLLSFYEEQNQTQKNIPKEKKLTSIASLGKHALVQISECYQFINFIGLLFFEMLRLFYKPKQWRWNTVVSVINKSGTSALPIIALLSLMIGIVLAYQMGNQLRDYGADVFIVNLIGFSVLREFGPLLTAIMVSGRTGSAFTAQLGHMKINQELDAINTMGITSAELLLLPRLIALFIVVPLLTIWADIFGVLGGMAMAQHLLGIGGHEFITRFQHEIPLRALLIGLGKAPVFALIIASVGCFQGMEVSKDSESVGTRTTRSVVLAIFFIIIVDALFTIVLSWFKL
jgi:phospholipid/cholesterol/gamma-HCH transport system permease protein